MDNTNGALCMLASTSTTAAAGGIDFNAATLQLVPSTTWQPPAKSASVTTASGALSDGKYGIVKTPAAAVARTYTDGYFSTATFYMPKKASSYSTGFARFGKDNYAGIYCVSGSGSSSYFAAPATSTIKLTGAVSLAAGLFAIGSAVAITI